MQDADHYISNHRFIARAKFSGMSHPEFFLYEKNLLLRFLGDNEKNFQFFSLSPKKQQNLSSF